MARSIKLRQRFGDEAAVRSVPRYRSLDPDEFDELLHRAGEQAQTLEAIRRFGDSARRR